MAILAGSYECPPDFDQATREIFEECAKIWLTIPVYLGATTITPEAWRSHWSKANEKTSSSFSGRHFSHYIAGLRSDHDHVTMLHALVASLVTKRGIVLDRWSKGLSEMLEKIFGCSLITKLCSILLMQADFNATNKVIYGIRMLHNMRKYKLMPEEIYSKRNCLADDGTLPKVLFYNIVRQLRRPAGLALVDADNCYDRIAYPMASMVFQSFGVRTSAVKSILATIQNMKFYLRTGYGDYNGCAGGVDDSSEDKRKTQGMCQGNGAAPAAWTVTTIPMVAAQRRKNYGAHFIPPISGQQGHLIGGLFVDDINLFHLEMRMNENVFQAHSKLQDGIFNWGKLCIATGSALKPPKCSYYLILFRWKPDRTWVYEDNTVNKDLAVSALLTDSNLAEIKHL